VAKKDRRKFGKDKGQGKKEEGRKEK